MPAFTVEELMKFAFNGVAYKLPESIKNALKSLESCLEITDTPAEAAAAAAGQAHTHHRREHDSFNGGRANRYDTRGGLGKGQSSSESLAKRDVRGKPRKEDWSKKNVNDTKEDDWAVMRSFKPTKLNEKTGIEKTVNDVRVALNKMSVANYEKQKDTVLGYVLAYFNGGEVTTADTRRISKAIFDIASTNKFYSEIYASLYKELVLANSVFRDLLDEFIVGFTNTDSLPIYVDPDSDYDGFCAYSKACDTRKSTSTFFVNCLKLGLIPAEKLATILCEIVSSIHVQIHEEGKTKIVEESIENVFILATLSKTELANGCELWDVTIIPGIKQIVAERGAGHPSLSNRAAFKCMDLLDNL